MLLCKTGKFSPNTRTSAPLIIYLISDEPNQQTDSRISNSSGDVSASLPALTDSQGYLKLNEETNNAESDSSQHTGACEQSQSSASMPKETIGPAFENNNFPIINRNQTYDVS